MERRLGIVEPLNIPDALINIYVNLMANSKDDTFEVIPSDGPVIDCANYIIAKYQRVCSQSPVCSAAVYGAHTYADTVCGTCYMYNNTDNPIYRVRVMQLYKIFNSIDAEYVDLSTVYLLRKLRIDDLTYVDAFRMMFNGLRVLSNLISERLNTQIGSVLRANSITQAISVPAKGPNPNKNMVPMVEEEGAACLFKTYLYEIVNDILGKDPIIIDQLLSVTALYKELFLNYNTDNPQDVPKKVSDSYQRPWTTRDRMFGIQLSDDYWDNVDLSKLINETSLEYVSKNPDGRNIQTTVDNVENKQNFTFVWIIIAVMTVIIIRSYSKNNASGAKANTGALDYRLTTQL